MEGNVMGELSYTTELDRGRGTREGDSPGLTVALKRESGGMAFCLAKPR